MKDHIPTIAIVVSLGMVLATIVFLWFHGAKTEGPVLLGLVGAVSTAIGILGGFSQNKNTPAPPPGTTLLQTSEPIPNASTPETPAKDTTK